MSFLGDVPLWLFSLAFEPQRRAVHAWQFFVARMIVRINPFWRVRVVGPDRLPPGTFVVCSNHQSNADVFCLAFVRGQYRYLAKRSLLKVPVLGWAMQLEGHVSVQRGDPSSGEAALAACRRWLDQGVSVWFFPEGTRSETGEVKDFKMGAFKLAVEAQVPVLPVVITGTSRALPKHGFVMRQRSRVRIQLGEPVPPGEDANALRDHVRETIVHAKAQLEREPG